MLRAHMLHIVKLITEGKSDTGEEMSEVKKLTYDVIRTAMLLGINIINSSYQERNERPVNVESDHNESEDKAGPKVKEEVVEVADGYKDMDLEDSPSGHEYVEVKEECFEEEIKLETNESVEVNENLKRQTSPSQMKIKQKENHIENILRRSREIVRATIGPIRRSSSNYPSGSGLLGPWPSNNNITHHHPHPYAWWGHHIYMMNHPNFSRGPDTGSWPNRGRGGRGGGFGHWSHHPY